MGTALTLEQTRLLSRYTKELVLCYDNDDAGQAATQKAIALLENSEFNVRVIQLPRRLVDGEYKKQDVDDFIKFQGADAFEAILNGSANQMDYRMAAVAARYDLQNAEQRVAYAGEISRLIASVPNAVEREVYAGRAAEKAGVSKDAMLLEVKRAHGKLRSKERQQMRKENLNVNALRQPRQRSIRYEDTRSAMAEEGVIRLLFLDSALSRQCRDLTADEFSAPLLGRIYSWQMEVCAMALAPSPSGLEGRLSPEEMGHLTSLLQKPESLAEAGRSLPDYISIIKESANRRLGTQTGDPLLAAQNKYKEKKGYGGKQHG